MPFPEFGEERDAADAVKQTQKILVIIGNPPYNAFAGIAQGEEQDLVAPYKEGLIKKWGIKKFNLDELYVRFFRLAERRIAEQGGRGVVCYISNFSWLTESSFVVMREHLLSKFDALWLDNLNGDSRETGKLTPEGLPDPSVFSTPYNREGIQKGTAVSLLVKRGNLPLPSSGSVGARVLYRQFWGTEKRGALLGSLGDAQFNSRYQLTDASAQNRYSFRPGNVTAVYGTWPMLTELCETAPANGLMEKRGGALIDIERDALESRMRAYFKKSISWEQLSAFNSGLTEEAAGYEPRKARDKVRAAENFDPARLRRYAVRPFETRWCYYTSVNPLWNRPRPSLWAQCWEGNRFLMSRPAGVASPEGLPLMHTACLGDNDFLRGHAYYFPFWLRTEITVVSKAQPGLFDEVATADNNSVRANLSATARSYLAALGLPDPDADRDTAALIWHHALAIGYSPAYLEEHADGIRQDWPRIPLPDSAELLRASAALGQQIAALLDSETAVQGVTSGTIREELKSIAVIYRVGGGTLQQQEFALTAGWGHGGKNGVTMPGRGKIEERAAGDEELDSRLRGHDGSLQTFDVYLNNTAYWKNIPPAVWNYTIGGYQVIKKWLSYREQSLLGRPLTSDEVREVTAMARRIAGLVLLHGDLDQNYLVVKSAVYAAPLK